MKTQTHMTLRIILAVVALYHIAAGIAATFFKEAAAQVGSYLFGVSIVMDSQAELLVRYLGAFGIAFGIMAALAALAPERNKTFIYGAIVYFLVRAFDRIAFAGLLAQHAVGGVPNWWRIIVILLFAGSLLWLLPRQPKESPSAAS